MCGCSSVALESDAHQYWHRLQQQLLASFVAALHLDVIAVGPQPPRLYSVSCVLWPHTYTSHAVHALVVPIHLLSGVEDVELMMDKENPEVNRGFGFITFYNYACAEVARRKYTENERT
jgi:hypothetical protein